MGRREKAEIRGFGRIWEVFWGFGFLGGTSEKGSTRKYTENWVTRWTKLFWGNLAFLR
jgi:hypothetical protein